LNDDNQYAVEYLRERRNRGRMIEYLVKWQGYGEAHNSWVKEADIHPGLIEVFHFLFTKLNQPIKSGFDSVLS
jgi:hypothetical protein